ncbi:uncharacterized protein L199_007377 [Kwoniella botswanensis]|uniref:uncharacterized protein n=1 Tax=Kwoniella botswanensis TaxID=1268659 RepID=UPI00315C7B7B
MSDTTTVQPIVLITGANRGLGLVEDAKNAVKDLTEKYGIDHIDVVIANSAVGTQSVPILDITPEEFTEHFNVNTRGVLLLYQATRELLLKGDQKNFVIMSSILATLSRPWHKVGMITYGTSKVALNYLARGIHFEDESLITFTFDPGHINTRLGQKASEFLGYPPPHSVEDTAPKIVRFIEDASRAETSGGLWRV